MRSLIAAAFYVGLLASITLSLIERTTVPSWRCVYSDEFNSQESLKHYNFTFPRIINKKLSMFAVHNPQLVSVHDGLLSLRCAGSGIDFETGMVTTHNFFTFYRGKLEIRANIPQVQGVSTTIWLIPDDDSWPPEIDMVGNAEKVDEIGFHYYPTKAKRMSCGAIPVKVKPGWHIYSMIIDNDRILWSVDNQNQQNFSKYAPPDRKMYLILEQVIYIPGEKNVWPASYIDSSLEVDYIRSYIPTKTSLLTD